MPAASVSSRTSRVSRPPTVTSFTPESQETPLNAKALLELPRLKKSNNLEALQKHLAQATEYLTKSVGDINDNAFEERTRHQNKVARLRNSNEEEPAEEKEQFDKFQQSVEDLTKKMDQSIRTVIDDQAWARQVPDAIEHVHSKTRETETRIAQKRQQQMDQEEDEDVDNTVVAPDASDNATALLHAAQSTAQAHWNAKTMEERYAKDNNYIGFYTTVWQTKNQGEHAPPVPNSSLWFAKEDGLRIPHGCQKPGAVTGKAHSDDEEMEDSGDEVQIASEQQRLTCPLTLRPFENPVTSTRCPHSFEKDAILDMINRSREYLPWTPEQQAELGKYRREQDRRRREAQIGTKLVRCPESGCEARITESDLRPDPALLRRVRRFQEAKRRQEEAEQRAEMEEHDIDEDDEDNDLPKGSQRRNVVPINSSPALADRRRTLIKGERVSVVPQTQLSSDNMEDE